MIQIMLTEKEVNIIIKCLEIVNTFTIYLMLDLGFIILYLKREKAKQLFLKEVGTIIK